MPFSRTFIPSLRAIALAGLTTLGLSAGAQAYEASVTTDLNMRSGPGTAYRVLDTIPRGDLVRVGRCDGTWCRVVYDGLRGWTSSRYLREVDIAPIVRGPRRVVRPAEPVIVERRRDYPRFVETYPRERYVDRPSRGGSVTFGVTIGTDNAGQNCYRTQYGDIVCR